MAALTDGPSVVSRLLEPGTANDVLRILGQAAIDRVHCLAKNQRETEWQS
jgi:hypothetical protein